MKTKLKKYYKKRISDVQRLLENKAYYLTSPNRTEEEIEKTIKYLKNFDITPKDAEFYLKRYWARERKKTRTGPLERDPVIGRALKMKRLRERMNQ